MEIPFSEPRYRTNESFIRGSGMGQDIDRNVAMSIAMSKAQEDLGGQIETVVKQQVLEMSNRTSDSDMRYKLEQNSKTIVNQALNNYEIMDKMNVKLKDGQTQVWLVLQMARSEVQKKLEDATR